MANIQNPVNSNSIRDKAYENLNKVSETNSKRNNGVESQKLFIMRHGERIDFTFGSWIPHSFDERGSYIRKDLNMPNTLPIREMGPGGYIKDSPLTNIGILQATLVGEALKENNIVIDHVYCSPSFRCIQTCDGVLKGLGKQNKLKIKIEPGLFEWLIWYPDSLPNWLSEQELIAAGYNIDKDYEPLISKTVLIDRHESCELFYSRSAFITKKALELHDSGNILFVGHGGTLDVCSRELLGKEPLNASEFNKLLQKVPYCSMMVLEKNEGTWNLSEPPCPPITHSNNQRFDWRVMQ